MPENDGRAKRGIIMERNGPPSEARQSSNGVVDVSQRVQGSWGASRSELDEEARQEGSRFNRYPLKVTSGLEKWSAAKYLGNRMEAQKLRKNFQPHVGASRRFDEKITCTTYFLWTE